MFWKFGYKCEHIKERMTFRPIDQSWTETTQSKSNGVTGSDTILIYCRPNWYVMCTQNTILPHPPWMSRKCFLNYFGQNGFTFTVQLQPNNFWYLFPTVLKVIMVLAYEISSEKLVKSEHWNLKNGLNFFCGNNGNILSSKYHYFWSFLKFLLYILMIVNYPNILKYTCME